MPLDNQKLRSEFAEEDRKVIVKNVMVGCGIGFLLMPAGSLLDLKVYPPEAYPGIAWAFFKLRAICSLLIAVFFLAVISPVGRKHPRPLGIILALFPSSFISVMIYMEGGSESLYYAGLNLVLLVIGFVLHWTLAESAVAVSLVIAMYVTACWLHGPLSPKEFFNNMYFLALTGIIVMVGSWVHTGWRLRDFRQRKELEWAQDQLVQNEREKLMTDVSRGIVHDVGNLLAPVTNYVFKLKKLAAAVPEDRRPNYLETLTKIERPMNAARGVLATLQRYAHANPQMSHECALHGLIEDALNLVRPKCEEAGIVLTCQVDPQFVVLGQPLDITMMFKNLLDNAVDATKAKTYRGEAPGIWIESRVEGSRGFLVFRDNGIGIRPEDMSHLFTPFYSTKGAGNGTGIGLVNCHKTISRLGGKISARSELGRFAEFTLEFPRHPLTGENQEHML